MNPRPSLRRLPLLAGALWALAAGCASNGDLEIYPEAAKPPAVASSEALGEGLAFLHRGDAEQAVIALERARKNGLADGRVHAALGLAYDQLWRRKEAQRSYRAALRLTPDDAHLWNNLGMSQLAGNQLEDAVGSFSRGAELRPGDTRIQNNLGLALGRLGRDAEALEAFRRAGGEADAQNNLGYVHYLNGDFQRAIHHYERALSGSPGDQLAVVRNLRAARAALEQREDEQ
jgi:Flp pilus assembly protein TadD